MLVLVGTLFLPVGRADAATDSANGYTWTYEVVSTGSRIVGTTTAPCIISTAKGEITVPDKLGGRSVTQVGINAFSNCTKVTRIILPASVTKVLPAFYNCTALTNVTVSADTLSFEEKAFVACPALVAFTSESPKYEVEDGLLYTAGKTELVRCPSGKATLALAESVTNIQKYALNQTPVTSLHLPAALKGFSPNAFIGADALENVTVADESPHYASIGGVVYDKDVKELALCPPARTILTVALGVTKIGGSSLIAASRLTSVFFPKSVTTIDSNAFAGLRSVNVLTFAGPVPVGFNKGGYGSLPVTRTCRLRYNAAFAPAWEDVLSTCTTITKERVSDLFSGLLLLYP